jgi:hypothetical protein
MRRVHSASMRFIIVSPAAVTLTRYFSALVLLSVK